MIYIEIVKRTSWETWPERVKAPYYNVISLYIYMFLSRFGHEKSGLNLGGPPSKAK